MFEFNHGTGPAAATPAGRAVICSTMCAGCYSAFAAAGSSVPVVAVMAAHTWSRVRDRCTTKPRLERALDAWEDTADFLHRHGLDPLEVLGPPPGQPVTDDDRSLPTT